MGPLLRASPQNFWGRWGKRRRQLASPFPAPPFPERLPPPAPPGPASRGRCPPVPPSPRLQTPPSSLPDPLAVPSAPHPPDPGPGAGAERSRSPAPVTLLPAFPCSPQLLLGFTILSLFSGHRPYFFSYCIKNNKKGKKFAEETTQTERNFSVFECKLFRCLPLHPHPHGSEFPAIFWGVIFRNLFFPSFAKGLGLHFVIVSILFWGWEMSLPVRGAWERGSFGEAVTQAETDGTRKTQHPPKIFIYIKKTKLVALSHFSRTFSAR